MKVIQLRYMDDEASALEFVEDNFHGAFGRCALIPPPKYSGFDFSSYIGIMRRSSMLHTSAAVSISDIRVLDGNP